MRRTDTNDLQGRLNEYVRCRSLIIINDDAGETIENLGGDAGKGGRGVVHAPQHKYTCSVTDVELQGDRQEQRAASQEFEQNDPSPRRPRRGRPDRHRLGCGCGPVSMQAESKLDQSLQVVVEEFSQECLIRHARNGKPPLDDMRLENLPP